MTSQGMFEFTPEVERILGTLCFAAAPIATLLRKDGRDIPTKAEAEQAHVIYWMLEMYEKHGEDWRDEGEKVLKKLANSD